MEVHALGPRFVPSSELDLGDEFLTKGKTFLHSKCAEYYNAIYVTEGSDFVEDF